MKIRTTGGGMSKAWIVSYLGAQWVAFGRTKNQVLCSIDIVCSPLSPEPEITRAKKYDIFAEQGFVPAKVLLEDGWELPCKKCGETVNIRNFKVSGMWALVGDDEVICCPSCIEYDEGEESV